MNEPYHIALPIDCDYGNHFYFRGKKAKTRVDGEA